MAMFRTLREQAIVTTTPQPYIPYQTDRQLHLEEFGCCIVRI